VRIEQARAAVVAGRDVQACHRLLSRLAPLDFAAEDATAALLRAAPLPARAAVGLRSANRRARRPRASPGLRHVFVSV
jgi:hypothetical protein